MISLKLWHVVIQTLVIFVLMFLTLHSDVPVKIKERDRCSVQRVHSFTHYIVFTIYSLVGRARQLLIHLRYRSLSQLLLGERWLCSKFGNENCKHG